MKAHHHDACGHTRPRDRFLGSVEHEGQTFDVYVYQDNALSARKPDMHLCLRYGDEGSQYVSPGGIEAFLEFCEESPLYRAVRPLVEKWRTP